MKAFFLRHKKLHLWLLADLCLLAAFFLCRGNRRWMNALTSRVTTPLQAALGHLTARVPFSVMEAIGACLAVGAVLYAVWSVIAVARSDHRRSRLYSAALGAVCAALTAAAAACFLWGVYFWADGFQDRSGIYAQPVSREDLTAVTSYFAQQLGETAEGVARDEGGVFAVDRETILAQAPEVYTALEAEFPFLTFADTGVKPMAFSRLMSRMDFTGFYCAFTGEANVNVDSPACLLPSTAAHEMAHQRGIASEQECNFLAVLASTASGDPVYAYSGWLMGYIYLGNALYSADPEAYWAIRDTLPDTVRADLADNNAYWDQFRDTVAQTVSNKVYDGILKSYGDQRGIRSYGTVVDLLVVYYRDRCAA
ncbi:MAG: DUF3810 domain-containing protein [Oscillibacter sp.]|nr:DUF3810 domain-containing protein [Oscillibacter sp.]